MTNVNHELFEFNKMILVYIFSIFIFFLWGLKMISEKGFFIRRTILDIPILLFLGSQIISTVFSMDPHTSFWGYYSRFNGGLLSLICYIFLYYALVSNFFGDKENAKEFGKKLLLVSLISAGLVALWGIPSRFGYDPTCMIFGRGLNTACWTAAFDPTARIFSTLGQPNWLAAYLAILTPISIALFINSSLKLTSFQEKIKSPFVILFAFLTLIFYIAITWTNSQSGFIGLWIGLFVFAGSLKLVSFKKAHFNPLKHLQLKSIKLMTAVLLIFLVTTFLIGNPFPRFQSFSLPRIISQQAPPPPATEAEIAQQGPALEYSITGSGQIRLIVWKGALEIFRTNPIFGTGVETFAYAYYKNRPVEHNLTSEWDYLYNKAHNEYLNYLATTGAVGLLTYLLFIALFLFVSLKFFLAQKKLIQTLIPASITAGFVTIIVSNFFGFSVVLLNLYLFMLPAIFLLVTGDRKKMLSFPAKSTPIDFSRFTATEYLLAVFLTGFSLYALWNITNLWIADKEYALGYNFNKIEEYVRANPPLEKAVKLRPSEDLYKNELSTNLASLALAFAQDNQTQNASIFAQRALDLSNEVDRNNPNNVVFKKTRTRTLFTLAQMQPELLNDAYKTILEAQKLAPTDAKILYNKALIEEVNERPLEALDTLNEAIKIKSNYLDAKYRKAIVLMSLMESDSDNSEKYREEAQTVLTDITTNLAPDFTEAKELLKTLE